MNVYISACAVTDMAKRTSCISNAVVSQTATMHGPFSLSFALLIKVHKRPN